MTYTTQAELVSRYGEDLMIDLTDRADPPAGAIDGSVVTQALTETDALIDGHLATRYQLPLASTPPMVADLARAIAIYKLHIYTAPEKISDDYKDAQATLNRISSGAIRLPIAGIEPAQTDAGGAQVTDRDRPFTAQKMKGWI